MPYCVVKKCKNTSATVKENSGLSFHKFPRDPVLRKKWIKAVRISRGNKTWSPSNFCVICSAHFDEKNVYTTNTGLRRIRKTAVPTKNILICAGKTEKILCEVDPGTHVENSAEKTPQSPNASANDPLLCPKVEKSSDDDSDQESNDEDESKEAVDSEIETDSKPLITFKPVPVVSTPARSNKSKPFKNDPSTSNSTDLGINESDLDSDSDSKPDVRTEAVKQKLLQCRKKLKSLQQKIRRLNERNASLVSILKTLGHHNSDTDDDSSSPKRIRFQSEEIQRKLNENAISTEIFRNLYTRKGKALKFSPAMREFCLTLDFYSPNAYEYIRETFGSCLPHRKTLAKWHRDSGTGSSQDMGIKEDEETHEPICDLMIGHMEMQDNDMDMEKPETELCNL